jgi:hypothetical protein
VHICNPWIGVYHSALLLAPRPAHFAPERASLSVGTSQKGRIVKHASAHTHTTISNREALTMSSRGCNRIVTDQVDFICEKQADNSGVISSLWKAVRRHGAMICSGEIACPRQRENDHPVDVYQDDRIGTAACAVAAYPAIMWHTTYREKGS